MLLLSTGSATVHTVVKHAVLCYWAYTIMATNHDGHNHDGRKVYHDGHSNENVKTNGILLRNH